jgi:hypothetical protein
VLVDSDHAADTVTRRLMTGVVLRLGDVLCRWGAKRRHSVGLSTCEAEYYATTCGAQEDSLWVGHILAFFIGGRSSVDVHLIAASLSDGIRTGRLWSKQASSRMRPTQSEVLCARCHCVLLGSTSRDTNRMIALYTPKTHRIAESYEQLCRRPAGDGIGHIIRVDKHPYVETPSDILHLMAPSAAVVS